MNGITKYGESGKTIVFLPGGGADLRCYLPLVQKLAAGNIVYTVNFPLLKTVDFEDTVAQVRKLLGGLNSKQIVIVGHSFGADVAQVVSPDSEIVEKVILINPKMFQLTDTNVQLLTKLFTKFLTALVKYQTAWGFHFKICYYLLANLIIHPQFSVSHNRQSLNNMRNPQTVVQKNNKNVIICSTKDIFFPLKAIPEEIKKNAIIVEGNHDWLMNDIDYTVKLIEQHIN